MGQAGARRRQDEQGAGKVSQGGCRAFTNFDPLQAEKTLHHMKTLFEQGAIFLEAGKGTCVHTLLSSLRRVGVTKFLGGGQGSKTARREHAVAIGWPAPEDVALREPVEKAKSVYKLFAAFFRANFPCHEEVNAYVALDVTCRMSFQDRKKLVNGIAVQHQLDPDCLWSLGCLCPA